MTGVGQPHGIIRPDTSGGSSLLLLNKARPSVVSTCRTIPSGKKGANRHQISIIAYTSPLDTGPIPVASVPLQSNDSIDCTDPMSFDVESELDCCGLYRVAPDAEGGINLTATSGRGSRFDRDLLHGHWCAWAVVGIRRRGSDGIHDLLAFGDVAEDGVVGWQGVVGVHDEELRTVGVRPGIRHGDRPHFIPTLVHCR
jgi:hypothetical protein